MNTLTSTERRTLRKQILAATGTMPRGLSDDAMAQLAQELALKTKTTEIETMPQIIDPPPLMPTTTTSKNPTTATTPPASTQEALNALIATLTPTSAGISEEQVKQLIAEHSQAPRVIEIKQHSKETKTITDAHEIFPQILRAATAYPITSVAPYIVGAAGCGKTHLAEQLAEALDVPFYAINSVQDSFQVTGYNDAQGEFVETEAFKAFTRGGLLFIDEIDNSAPEALVAINMLLANKFMVFADKMHRRHPEFYVIAAGNTAGRGANSQYSARSQLDGSTMTRFSMFTMNYSDTVEHQVAHNTAATLNADYDKTIIDAWINEVRSVRTFLAANNSDVIISPRQTQSGAATLAQGATPEEARQENIYGFLSEDQTAQVKAAL